MLNEENVWDGEVNCEKRTSKTGDGEECRIQRGEVETALRKMKADKAAGPSGIVAEMLQAAEIIGVERLTDLLNKIINCRRTYSRRVEQVCTDSIVQGERGCDGLWVLLCN